MKEAFYSLKRAGCKVAYIDGSFVTSKYRPKDFDACWEVEGVNPSLLDPVLLDFSDGRKAQKLKYGGELFPASVPNGSTGKTFLEFFQTDRETGERKGIVAIDLEGLA